MIFYNSNFNINLRLTIRSTSLPQIFFWLNILITYRKRRSTKSMLSLRHYVLIRKQWARVQVIFTKRTLNNSLNYGLKHKVFVIIKALSTYQRAMGWSKFRNYFPSLSSHSSMIISLSKIDIRSLDCLPERAMSWSKLKNIIKE